MKSFNLETVGDNNYYGVTVVEGETVMDAIKAYILHIRKFDSPFSTKLSKGEPIQVEVVSGDETELGTYTVKSEYDILKD